MEETNNNPLNKIGFAIKNSLMLKLLTIAIVALVLLIPASQIETLIHERQMNREIVTKEVSSKWGEDQMLSGPILNVPYNTFYLDQDGNTVQQRQYAHFLPTSLLINGQITPQVRKRGIYEVVLYNTALNFSGHFDKPDFSLLSIEPKVVLWDEAYISIGVPDMGGIQKKMILEWNGEKRPVQPGLPEHEVINAGLISRVDASESDAFKFNLAIDLNGSKQISFIPTGKQTVVNVSSTWENPSFNGEFLPDHHEITAAGFTAEWTILDVNRNFPQQWLGSSQDIDDAAFGLALILPVDEYQKNMRSVKYALLVIALTFLIFFLIEVLNKKRFHTFQYIMVGFAIVLFYSLLISFTEHIGFNMAYLISSTLVIGLITAYVAAIFRNKPLTFWMALLLSIIYFFIFVILQLQDFALLVGSLGLFAALAALMYLSRNINWYELKPAQGSQKS